MKKIKDITIISLSRGLLGEPFIEHELEIGIKRLKTFYGQAFLPDVCELEEDMLPYTKSYFKELIET